MAGGAELLMLVDTIHREKDIDPETLFAGIEIALETAVRKKYEDADVLEVRIDRQTGQILAYQDGLQINASDLGRIAAQTAKQVIIQKIREAEQDVVFDEFETRKRELSSGAIQRFERDDIIVALGRGEGVLPRSERVRGENPRVGDRIRALVLDVKRMGNRVRIILSRTHPDLIRRLFELEVPEIADGIIEIKHLAREPGYRTKIAVTSYDPKIDCVGACVGVRGSRIRNIIDELNGEKIDIIRWNDSAEVLIMNALKPAEIESITLNDDTGEAEVVVDEEQLSLAIGKKGQNVRLAAKLTGWAINIVGTNAASPELIALAAELDGEGALPGEEGSVVAVAGEVTAQPGGDGTQTEMMATQVVAAAEDQLADGGSGEPMEGSEEAPSASVDPEIAQQTSEDPVTDVAEAAPKGENVGVTALESGPDDAPSGDVEGTSVDENPTQSA